MTPAAPITPTIPRLSFAALEKAVVDNGLPEFVENANVSLNERG
jgi:hypothetical protein